MVARRSPESPREAATVALRTDLNHTRGGGRS